MKKSWILIYLFLLTTLVVRSQVDDSKLLISSTSNGAEEAAIYAQLLQDTYQNGEYDLSKTYSDSLLLIAELYNIADMGVVALNSQAIYYKNKGDKEKAITLYHKALRKTDSFSNNKGPKAMILVNMGNIYTDIGAYDKSIATMDSLLAITDTIRSFSKIKAAALVGQSTNYIELNQYDKGLEYCERALELADFMQDGSVKGTVLNNLSDIYIATKDYRNALVTTEKALTLKEVQKPTKSRGWLLLNNGISHFHLAQFDKALNSFKESLTLAQQKNLPLIEMYSYEYLAKLYEKQKDFEKSFQAQKEYSRIKDVIEGDEKKAVIVDMNQDIETNKVSLEATKQELQSTHKNNKNTLFYGILFVGLLLGLMLFMGYKKRIIERENIDLRQQYDLLKQAIDSASASDRKELNRSIQNTDKPYENSSLTEGDRQLHKQRILQMMRLEKPYLNPDLRLSEIAKKLDVSTAHFSEVLHYGFGENFHNFINFYRVVEAQKLMKKENQKDSKIIAIAFDAGFKSKTTFNRVFKNYTGLTPSEYRKTCNC